MASHEEWTRERVAGLVRECGRYAERVKEGTEFALFDDVLAFMSQLDRSAPVRMEFHRILNGWSDGNMTNGQRVFLHCIHELHNRIEAIHYIRRPWCLVQWFRALRFTLSRRWRGGIPWPW